MGNKTKRLGVKRKTRRQVDMERIKASMDFRKLVWEKERNEQTIKVISDMLVSYRQENNKIRNNMTKIIKKFRSLMDNRDWCILKMRTRVSNRQTLESIAKKYNVTRERIRQREARAFKIIYKYFDSEL